MGIFRRARGPSRTEVTAEVVEALIRDQVPDLADRPVVEGPRGWANQMWRLGGDLAVRLPWQDSSSEALVAEHTWLPELAARLPLPVPVPCHLGQPSDLFPHPWIVTTWIEGHPADRAPVTRGAEAADALAAFVTALHRPAPPEAPDGRGRGGALAEVAAVRRSIPATARMCAAAAPGEHDLPDPAAVRAIWDDAVGAAPWTGPRTWLHGDLHPANVLTTPDGTLAGVVDFGELCAGDPALDLAACWILLPDQAAIERFRAATPAAADDATWRQARGWAIWRAFGCLAIATAGPPGGKPTWGPPAVASLRRLTASTP